jgi:AcrR family transcriptional regulator
LPKLFIGNIIEQTLNIGNSGLAKPAGSRPKAARKPVRQANQARSRATVEAILESATRILADIGWADLTTNLIARRAGVSIGSVYEFFPDKRAIVDEIISRHMARGEVLLRESGSERENLHDPETIVRLLVAGFVGLHSDNPKLHRVLSHEVPLSKAQIDRVEQLRSGIIDLVAGGIAGHVDAPRLKATILVDTADALSHRWLVDAAGTPASQHVMSSELRKMLSSYLAS